MKENVHPISSSNSIKKRQVFLVRDKPRQKKNKVSPLIRPRRYTEPTTSQLQLLKRQLRVQQELQSGKQLQPSQLFQKSPSKRLCLLPQIPHYPMQMNDLSVTNQTHGDQRHSSQYQIEIPRSSTNTQSSNMIQSKGKYYQENQIFEQPRTQEDDFYQNNQRRKDYWQISSLNGSTHSFPQRDSSDYFHHSKNQDPFSNNSSYLPQNKIILQPPPAYKTQQQQGLIHSLSCAAKEAVCKSSISPSKNERCLIPQQQQSALIPISYFPSNQISDNQNKSQYEEHQFKYQNQYNSRGEMMSSNNDFLPFTRSLSWKGSETRDTPDSYSYVNEAPPLPSRPHQNSAPSIYSPQCSYQNPQYLVKNPISLNLEQQYYNTPQPIRLTQGTSTNRFQLTPSTLNQSPHPIIDNSNGLDQIQFCNMKNSSENDFSGCFNDDREEKGGCIPNLEDELQENNLVKDPDDYFSSKNPFQENNDLMDSANQAASLFTVQQPEIVPRFDSYSDY